MPFVIDCRGKSALTLANNPMPGAANFVFPNANPEAGSGHTLFADASGNLEYVDPVAGLDADYARISLANIDVTNTLRMGGQRVTDVATNLLVDADAVNVRTLREYAWRRAPADVFYLPDPARAGVGTSTPVCALDVSGAARVRGRLDALALVADTLEGDGAAITNLRVDASQHLVAGTVPVQRGGTGVDVGFEVDRLLLGNGTDPIRVATALVYAHDGRLAVGKTTAPALGRTLDVSGTLAADAFLGNGAALTDLHADHVAAGTFPPPRGGTGLDTPPPAGTFLIGRDAAALAHTGPAMRWDASARALALHLDASVVPAAALDVSGTVRAHAFVGNGADLTDLDVDHLATLVPVRLGGTGRDALPANALLLGNGADPLLDAAKLVYAPDASDADPTLDVSGLCRATAFRGDGRHLENLRVQHLDGILDVSRGGTGRDALPVHALLLGNGTDPLLDAVHLTYDPSNVRLGVGRPLPACALDVAGTVAHLGYGLYGLVTDLLPAALETQLQWTAESTTAKITPEPIELADPGMYLARMHLRVASEDYRGSLVGSLRVLDVFAGLFQPVQNAETFVRLDGSDVATTATFEFALHIATPATFIQLAVLNPAAVDLPTTPGVLWSRLLVQKIG